MPVCRRRQKQPQPRRFVLSTVLGRRPARWGAASRNTLDRCATLTTPVLWPPVTGWHCWWAPFQQVVLGITGEPPHKTGLPPAAQNTHIAAELEVARRVRYRLLHELRLGRLHTHGLYGAISLGRPR